MARNIAKARAKPKKPAALPAPTPQLSIEELRRQLTIRLLRRLRDLLHVDAIASYDVWPKVLANAVRMDESVVEELVEAEARITVGIYFGVTEVTNLKKVFEAVTGMGSERPHLAALKIVDDTIARLEKQG